ncbi:putative sulfate exporter family transporter [Flavobacterium sp.]|uniref:YeiH family protein n=1 Tax=Flavobacterium sp. TaxID=239 RepID=UPI0026021710|nr:putative sulfate exporter family transporter [Flavobacterium sp.]MDD3005559.1 putative sulfate exporter family transporter [Flavobacterium sp.]
MFKNKLPGIILAVIIVLIAKFLSGYLPTLGTALLALILGIGIRQVLFNFSPFSSGVAWTEKYVLETAIVFIGFGFEISKFKEIGFSTLALIFGSIIAVILVALLLQKLIGKEDGKLFWLLGAGSAICGSSAIGATAPLIQAKEEETGISLAVINVLGLLGMILLPVIALGLSFSNVETGIFLGGILQSVGHVVGSAFAINTEVGQFATVVKMGRVAFLVPFLLIVYFMFRNKSDGTKLKFPIFILFFLGAVLISQIGIFNSETIKFLSKSGDTLLNIGMAAIGLKINIKSLWKISGKAFVAGLIIFAVQILIYFVYLIIN